MTKIVAITGGIGSGKSTLSQHLKKRRCLVHESDSFVSNIYKKPKKTFINFIIKNKLSASLKNGKIDKKIVAEIIFKNQAIKKKLENFIHKTVGLERELFIRKNKNTKKKALFIDIPLLLERGLEKQFDHVVCVISTKKNRIDRILNKKKFSKKILKKIIEHQTTDKERKKKADIIIINNKSKKDFILSSERALIGLIK